MNNNDKDIVPKHPIGVVANRTGVTPDVLRAWERRYKAVVPQRTETGRRLYSDRDIARVALFKRLIAAGRRISDVAGLELEELEAIAKEDRGAERRETGGRGSSGNGVAPAGQNGRQLLETAIGAVLRYDSETLERTLAVAGLTMDPAELRRDLIHPLMREIGDRWRDGEIRVVQEHMASAIVRSFLEGLRKRPVGGSRPKIAVTTPSGQLHEMGALMAAAVADEAGWDVVYLGANLPAEEIGSGAHALGVRAVAVSLAFVEDEARAAEEIRSIRRHLGPGMPLIVGGRAASVLATAIREAGGVLVEDLDEFRGELDRALSP